MSDINFVVLTDRIITEIKFGIDNFNKHIGGSIRAYYPASVTISVEGITFTVPLYQMAPGEIPHE